MRNYGTVHTTIWASPTFRSMTDDGRTLVMYLLTCPHGTIAGAFRLPDGYACEDLQWIPERVNKGFAELLEKGFANRCETTKWVWITKHFEWNPPENPNQKKAAAKVAHQIPDECDWKLEYMRVCRKFFDEEPPKKQNPPKTLSKPFLNQEQEQEQEQEFLEAWAAYPKRKGGNSKADAKKAWNARIKAGVDPGVMLAGVKAYAAYIRGASKEGTEFVKQAATFFGPSEHYLDDLSGGGGDGGLDDLMGTAI